MNLQFNICRHHHPSAFATRIEVSFGECTLGVLPADEVFLGASRRRDSRRISWNFALVVRGYCQSEIP
jgi:hypothetical protein